MPVPRRLCTIGMLAAGLAAGLSFSALTVQVTAQQLDLPGPIEASARPATPDNPVPRTLTSPTPPLGASNLLRRASVEGYSGAVLLKVTIDSTGRVADARPIGVAVSGRSSSTHRVVQEDPLPSAEQLFAPDEAMTRAARDFITYARQDARQQQYQAPAGGPLSFHMALVSTASGRLTVATTNDAPDLHEIFPPSAVTSTEPPRFPTTGPSAPVSMTSYRWDPATGTIASAQTFGARPESTAPIAQPTTAAASSSSARQATGGAAGPGAAGIAAGTAVPSAPTASRATAPPAPAAPIRVGGNVMAPRKVRDVKPVYPADAQADRVQGIVILETTIDTSGKVTNAKVLRSIARLDDAAVDAVKQWEYEPTRLNGVPVPIIMSVTVNFTLAIPPQQ